MSPAPPDDLKARLKAEAARQGFAACGVAAPDTPQARARLEHWLAQGHHGQMHWMADREGRAGWRGTPRAMWPAVRSVVMLADSYAPGTDPLEVLDLRDRGAISVYAQGADYHDRIKPRLKALGRWLIDTAGGGVKVFVDTAPVMEKPLAQVAGLGWQGKHTNLLGRGFGNWVFLGAVFTTLEITPDPPEADHCGTCTACLEICPTRAFPAPHVLDARRCISYLTIEHRGPVEASLRPLMGNRIYGCDDCLAVCPWNKFAVAARETGYAHRHGAPPLAELAALDDAGFRARFAASPVKRIGRDRFLRNVLYAIGNAGDRGLAATAAAHRTAADPAVADAADWAFRRLTAPAESA